MAFPSVIELSSFNSATGFKISGVAAGDFSGTSVASAGDVNGDGFDDLIIGASNADPHGSASGASYVVFGKASGFGANLDLSTLNGTNGSKISGVAVNDLSGYSVASAGDVNGDGFDDLIIGAVGADPHGTDSGASYVVFGQTSGFGANLDLSTLDGTTGFKLSGVVADDHSGISVASAGDVNGDGFKDLIIGANAADPHGTSSGASYVVFGKASGFGANLDLSTLNGTTGFKLSGVVAGDLSGISVASAGDVNGDGFDDVIIGARDADPHGTSSGASYVVFGEASGFGANLDLSTLNGTNGFKISGAAVGDASGVSVASAGDVNGDGFDDVIIGAHNASPNGTSSGASYVVFGEASGFGANLDLSTLNGTNGFKISGAAVGDHSGISVASAGDFNGDGFDDLIIGAAGADPHGTDSGASYVVFGKASGFGANLDLSTLDGSTGFRLSGVANGDDSGLSVASAGDFNGDGFDDLIIGARLADANGVDSGASYVVFGRASPQDITPPAPPVVSGIAPDSGESSTDGITAWPTVTVNGSAEANSTVTLFNGTTQVGTVGADNGGSWSVANVALTQGTNNLTATATVPNPFPSVIELSSFNSVTGFKISGVTAGDSSGNSVASAGDVNGDGFADLIVGAALADPHGDGSGASYVVFGKASDFGTNLDLSALNGVTGFKMSGAALHESSGISVSSAGDFNGDGFDDLIIGADGLDTHGTNSGGAYVVFGKASGFSANIDLSTLNGTTGFRISGASNYGFAGSSVASAGDINGDGFDDIIIGATFPPPHGSAYGASYVVFGKASGFTQSRPLDAEWHERLQAIGGVAVNDLSGYSVASAGDVNGDGFDDLIIGAPGADPHGSASGASYVVFGKASGFSAGIDLSTLNGTNGFKLSGVAGGDYSGSLGRLGRRRQWRRLRRPDRRARNADPHGASSGASYVVFGKASGFSANLDLSTLERHQRLQAQRRGGR